MIDAPSRPKENKQTMRSTLSMVYTGIIVGITLVVPGTGFSTGTLNHFFMFFGSLSLFFATFLIEFFNTPLIRDPRAKYLRFVLRMVMIELLLSTSPSPFLILLYPIVVFSGFFLFRNWTVVLMSLGYIAAAAYRTSLITAHWFYDPFFLTTIILISALLVLAYFVREDENNHRRSRELLQLVGESRDRLQVYAEKAAEVSATEVRNKIARDIHDTLGHYLTSIIIQLEKAEAFRKRDEKEADRAVSAARESAQKALQDIRQSISMIRDTRPFCLKDAIDELIEGTALQVKLEFKGKETPFSAFVLMTLFRAAQEGLTNIVKHAGVKCARLSLQLGQQEGLLCLEDRGKGFDPAQTSFSAHFGLVGLRERIELIQGRVELETAPGEGVRLTVKVPANPEEIISGEGDFS